MLDAREGEGSERLGKEQKVVFLSDPESEATIRLDAPVRNDLEAESGQTVPFTYCQRYASLQALREGPRTTSELIETSDGSTSG